MKGFAIFLLAMLATPALGDNWERAPRPYDLVGVRLSWVQIPYPTFNYEYDTGWQLSNPDAWGCEEIYLSTSWFKCRIRVDPLTRVLTIKSAQECQP